jgi:multicomponent Na+:H+ antiporter subunit A
MLSALVPIVLALAAGPVTALVGAARPAAAGLIAVGTAGLAFGACALAWWTGSSPVDLPWAPTWGLRLRFAFDGLATLYALLATAVGLNRCRVTQYQPPSRRQNHFG